MNTNQEISSLQGQNFHVILLAHHCVRSFLKIQVLSLLKVTGRITVLAPGPRLAELTYAWNVASDAGAFGTEMLYRNIHPMQRLLPKTLLLRQYERVLCDVVADVGVDINKACAHDHLLGLLTLFPG